MFAKLFADSGADGVLLRKAHAVAKNLPFVAEFTPVYVGGEDARDLSDESAAIAQLKELGRDKWPTASEAQQFEPHRATRPSSVSPRERVGS
jgi:hypothetical protein